MAQFPSLQLSHRQPAPETAPLPSSQAGPLCCLRQLSPCPAAVHIEPWLPCLCPSLGFRPCPAACLGLGPRCPPLGLDFPFLGAPSCWEDCSLLADPDVGTGRWTEAQPLQQGPSCLCGLCRLVVPFGQCCQLVIPYPWLCHGALEGPPGELGPVVCSRGSSEGRG